MRERARCGTCWLNLVHFPKFDRNRISDHNTTHAHHSRGEDLGLTYFSGRQELANQTLNLRTEL